MRHKSRSVSHLATMLLSFAVLLLPVAAVAAQHQSAAPSTSAYAYVGSPGYPADGSIFEFAVAPDGSAQPVPGSPVSGADGALVSANSFVFATDGKNIVTYTVATNGSLSQTSSVDGTAYDQDQQYATVQSLTVPADGRNLYTDNWFVDGPNNAYESWKVSSAGQLTYLPTLNGLPLYSTAGGWPLTFTPDGSFAYTWSVCKWDGSVWAFKRLANGSLQYFQSDAQGLAGNGPDSWSLCSQGVANSSLGFVAVAWNGGYCCGGPQGIASYSIQSNGTLRKTSQVETVENAMAFDPSGRYLAVAVASGIQMYQLQNNGALTAIGGVVEPAVPFTNLAWDSAGHLYGTNPNSQACQNNQSACGLYIFNSNAGVLSLAAGSPHTISQPGALTVLSR